MLQDIDKTLLEKLFIRLGVNQNKTQLIFMLSYWQHISQVYFLRNIFMVKAAVWQHNISEHPSQIRRTDTSALQNVHRLWVLLLFACKSFVFVLLLLYKIKRKQKSDLRSIMHEWNRTTSSTQSVYKNQFTKEKTCFCWWATLQIP